MKKFLIAICVVIANVFAAISEELNTYVYESNYGVHGDKIKIPNANPIKTEVQANVMTKRDTIVVKRASYDFKAKGYSHVRDYVTVLAKDYLYAEVIAGDKTYPYFVIDLVGDEFSESVSNYRNVFEVPSATYLVNYDMLDRSFKAATNGFMSDLGADEITIRFRLGIYAAVSRDNDGTRIFYVSTEPSATFTLYNCHGGEIDVKPETLPVLEDKNNQVVYALYPTELSAREPAFSLYSVEDASRWSTMNQSLTWTVGRNLTEAASKKTTPTANTLRNQTYYSSGKSFDYAELSEDGQLRENDLLTVSRTLSMQNNLVSCSTDPLVIRVVRPLVLKGLPDTTHYVCAYEEEFSYESTSEKWNDESKWLHIHGEKVNVDDLDYAFLYDIQYIWEYRNTRSADWTELPLKGDGGSVVEAQYNCPTGDSNTYKFNPQDLVVPIALFKQGETYEFRQVVHLNGFGGRKIYAQGNGVVKVKTYDKINSSLFEVTPMGSLCADNVPHEVHLKATSLPNMVGNYKSACDGFFRYKYSFPYVSRMEEVCAKDLDKKFDVMSEDSRVCKVNISVSDGCGNVVALVDSLKFDLQPSIEEENIVCGNVVFKKVNGILTAEIPEGETYVLTISRDDPDYSLCDYLYSEDDSVYTKIGSRGQEVSLTSSYSKRIYLKKRLKLGNQCESEAVIVDLYKIGVLRDNVIPEKNYYVCEGSLNPEIGCLQVSGGYGVGTYSYKWIYSTDRVDYKPMMAGTDLITTMNLSKEQWSQIINDTYYIKRIAYSSTEEGTIADTSDYVTIMPYSKPTMTLSSDVTAVCYDSLVTLQMSQDEQSLSQLFLSAKQGRSANPSYAYVMKSMEGDESDGLVGMTEVGNAYSFRVTKDTVVYAKLSLCGIDYYSSGVNIKCGENLRPQMSYGACRVRGGKMEVKVLNPVADWLYSIEQDGEQLGSTSADVDIPEVGSLNYRVRVVNGACEHIGSPFVDDTTFHEPFRHFDLEVNQVRGELVTLCAGEQATISNNSSEGNDKATNYEWSVNEVPVENNDKASLSYAFPLVDKFYTVVRTSKEIRKGTLCQSIVDTVHVKTHANVQGATLSLDNTGYVCPGDSVKWTLSGVTGGKMVSYKYELYDDKEKKQLGAGVIGVEEERSDYVKFEAGEHTLYAKVLDGQCSTETKLYEQTTSPKSVTQAQAADFNLKASPSLVNEDGSGKSTTVTITAMAGDDDLTLDEFVYSYKKSDGTEVSGQSVGGLFSIMVDSTSFTNDLLTLSVTRKVETTGCTASSRVTISQTQGFMQRPSLEVLPFKSEYCAGEEVTFSVPELPKFGELELTSSDVSYSWLRNGSLIGSDATCKVTAIAGETLGVMCMISYKYDASLRAAHVYSEEFHLEGKPGIHLGKVTELNSGSNGMSLCLGDTKGVFTLSVDAEIGEKDQLVWQQLLDGEEWSAIPDTCRAGGDLVNGQSIALLASSYTRDESTKYFRLKGVSECGVETYSSNIFSLKIEKAPSVPEVALRSENLIKDKVVSLTFSPTANYAGYSYHWGVSEDDLNQASSLNGAQVVVNGDFRVGTNTVYVYKQTIGGAQCASPMVKYDFDLYEELSIGDLVPTKLDTIRCPNENSVNLNVGDVKGGTGAYKIVWQYKTYGDNWIAFDSKSENLGFTATFYEGLFADSYQYRLSVSELSSSTSFRAIIGCEGEYSGTSKTTNAYTVSFYDPLKAGSVDLSEETLCYGTEMSVIKGELPSGGDGVYSFQWLRTATPEEENSWTVVSNATSQSYIHCDTLYEGTFFKRVVTDGCGTKLESRNKHIYVLPKLEIQREDINYAKVVRAGSGAKMWGVPRNPNDKSIYVWFNSDFQALDTTDTREIYTTTEKLSGGDSYKTYIFYAAKLDAATACLSHNYDTLYVTAYENVSGTIRVEGTEKETEDNFWVCSGDKHVELKSQSDPEEAEYRWYYRATTNANVEPIVGDWTLLRGTASIPVRGVNLSLDTCDVDDLFRNGTGRAKYVEIKRVAKFVVAEEETSVESNVIRINVVPTMKSVSQIYDLAGKLSTGQNIYCKGDRAVAVSGTVDSDSETMIVWRNVSKYFGPWLYDKDYNKSQGFTTWYECRTMDGDWDTVLVKHINDNGYATEFMPGEGSDHVMNSTYQVRRAVYDGCTSAYTDVLPLYVRDEVGKLANVDMYAIDDDGRSHVLRGFEIGDSMHVGYVSMDAYDCLWSLDSTFVDTMEASRNYCSFRIVGKTANRLMADPHVYMKRKSDGCWSSTLAIPVPLGSASDGGLIGYDQTVCADFDFGPIRSLSEAVGEWKRPVDAPMKWSYSWQFSIDSLTWATVSGADSTILSSVDVNRFTKLLDSKVTYFRRVAVNDSARVRYSNVVKLSYFEDLMPGELSLNTEKSGFCTYDELPTLISTPSTGGKTAEEGVVYSWYMKLNQGDYYEYKGYKGNTFNLLFEDSLMSLDRTENIYVNVKCQYNDVCGTVESQPLTLTLFRENGIPNIYQDNDSCDADEVTVKVIEDAHDKTYMFVAMLYSNSVMDSVIWSSEAKERTFRRHTSMMADEYGVYSVDETGCVSDYNYFNIDSLPTLQQVRMSAPNEVCYGEQFMIKGGPAIGGNGNKRYAWQYSYDGLSWEDLLNHYEEDLEVTNPTISAYYRRIVTDKCFIDTSSSVYVKVRDAVTINRDWLVMHDFKCAGQSFNVRLADSVSSMVGVDYYNLWRNGDEMISGFSGATMNGFLEDSMLFLFSRVVVDQMSKACESERIAIYAHNAVSIDHERNVISCENLTPCNGMVVDVVGERQSASYADRIKNMWYVSKDGVVWTEQLLQNESILRLKVEDTMYVRRLLYNGCQYDTSNVVTVIGTKVEEYDYLTMLGLHVVSGVDDHSVTLNMLGGKHFSEGYYFMGDGVLPVVESNETKLPYDAFTYKDSLLQIIAVSDICVSQYEVSPIRGGAIYFDGPTDLCGGSDIPAIVATDVEGGHGDYTYQWQYRNSYTTDFINIEGATKKEYTPHAVSVATDYRRVTMDGEYTSISNVITINIRPLPKVDDIFIQISDSALAAMGLNQTQYGVEKLPSMPIILWDSVADVDVFIWQKSYDALEWEDVAVFSSNRSNVYSYEMGDTASIVYVRAIGESKCGADTSKAYKVTTLYASFITDDELVLLDSICKGQTYVRIAYKSDYSDVYEYSYRKIGYEGTGAWAVSSDVDDPFSADVEFHSIRDTTRTTGGAIFMYPTKSFDVEITRYVKKTGASSKKMVHFFVDSLSADFSYLIDGVERHMSGERAQTVRINQGSRVAFSPEIKTCVENGEMSYKWQLMQPLNPRFYTMYGGSEGREGLVSELSNPACYFYNAGVYPIRMEVSDGLCSASVLDTALYIDQSSFRSYELDVVLDDEQVVPNMVRQYSWNVYPNPCVDYLSISCDSTSVVRLFDLAGTLLYEGCAINSIIDMRPFMPGAYLLSVDGGEMVKILKK